MKYATLSKSAFAVTAIHIATACANSDDGQVQDVAPVDPAPVPVPAAKPIPPEPVCTPSCKKDSDCEDSCPTVATGVMCCDAKLGQCFKKASACVASPPPPPPPPAGY